MAAQDRTIDKDEASSISRLSTLETLREQARSGHRDALVKSIENMIQVELRALAKLREHRESAESRPR